MAVAHDTATRFPATDNNAGDVTTGDRTFSHAGNASAKGALVLLGSDAAVVPVTGVLYGGTAMTLLNSATDTTEAGWVGAYFLGDLTGLGGTQTVTLQGCTADNKYAVCITVTAATARTIWTGGVNANTTTNANPSVVMPIREDGIVYSIVHGGQAAPTSYTLGANHTVLFGADYGQRSSRTGRTDAVQSGGHSTNYTFTWTAGSDDWCMIAHGIGEPRHPDFYQDNFDDGSIDSTKWVVSGAGESEASGVITLSQSTSFLISQKTFSLRLGDAVIKMASISGAGDCNVSIHKWDTPTHRITFNYKFTHVESTNDTGTGLLNTARTSDHDWVKFAKGATDDEVEIYTSPNGTNWTLYQTYNSPGTETNLSLASLDSLRFEIDNLASSAIDFDNFNNLPSVGTFPPHRAHRGLLMRGRRRV